MRAIGYFFDLLFKYCEFKHNKRCEYLKYKLECNIKYLEKQKEINNINK